VKYIVFLRGQATAITDALHEEQDTKDKINSAGGYETVGNAASTDSLPPGTWNAPATKSGKLGGSRGRGRK